MESRLRFFRDPEHSFFLFGPRGTGKSTWIRENVANAITVDLLEPDVFRALSARPELLRELVAGNTDRKVVVIDEVQRVPEILTAVHALMEKRKDLQFILTGSNARKLRRAGIDLLAGRALVKSLHPFMAAELGEDFDLDDALRHGLLPLVIASERPGDVLKSYLGVYVREEVQMEALVRNVGAFARFLESVSFSQGCPLNISNVARECQVERKVIEGYVCILEDLLLSFRIPVFAKRAKRAVSCHPKFYLFDAGVFRSIRPSGYLDRTEEIDGGALEGLVAQHLRAWIDYRGCRNDLFFWRTRSGVEVDFVVYGEEGLWAIEVKNSRTIRPEDLRPLKAFKEDYPESQAIFLYRGQNRIVRDGILCIPCEAYLRELHPESRLPGHDANAHTASEADLGPV